jgi:hypothetical protein
MEESKERSRKKIKKPYHLKKADVDLDGYKKDIQDRSAAHLLERAFVAIKTSRQFHLFLALQAAAAACGVGQIMLCIGWFICVSQVVIVRVNEHACRYIVDVLREYRDTKRGRKIRIFTV